MTGETIPNGRGVQALYHNIMQAKLRGFGTVPGNAPTPSVSSTDRAVDITAGEVLVDGDRITVDAQTTDTRTGDADPRRDIWYIDANGDLKVKEGTPAAPLQEQLDRGESTFELYEPHPPDSTGITGVVVAEAYIPANATDFQASEFLDLTVASKVDVDRYDGDKFVLGEADDWILEYDDDQNRTTLTEQSSGTTFVWEPDGDMDVPGALTVGSFDPSEITPDVLRVGSESILPVYADNANAVASDASIWFNDGSGPNAAGIYYYDGGVVGPLETGAGSAPGSLSGLSIDVTKDWGGYFITNVGHDGVRVPSSVNLTVEDWEEGTISDAWVETGAHSVVSDPANSGKGYVLKIDTSTSGSWDIYSNDGLPAYIEPGDEFSYSVYLSDSGTLVDLNLFGDARLDVEDNSFGWHNQGAEVSISAGLNEWLRVEAYVSEDGDASATLYAADGTELGTSTATVSTEPQDNLLIDAYNGSTGITAYVGDITVTRRTREYVTESEQGVVDLGGDVVDPSGAVATGPQETPTNPGKVMRTIVPVNDGATQGEEHGVVDDIAGSRAEYVATADGQGGAYAARAELPIGRLSRVNANLSWEYDALADVPAWTSADGGVSTWTYNVNGRPRRIHVEHDGSGSSDDFGGVLASVLTTVQSLGAFRITFKNVSFTDNDLSNTPILGVSDVSDASVRADSNGTGFVLRRDAGTNDYTIIIVDGGTKTTDAVNGPDDWTVNHDITFEYDGTDLFVFIDGVLQAPALTKSITGDFSPIIQLKEESAISAAETLEVEQVIVEAL